MDHRSGNELLLVTTAFKQVWGDDEEILFLGEWCRSYSRQEDYSDRKYQVVPNHWDDRSKLKEDESQLRCLHDKILELLVAVLNDVHSVNFPERYWQMIIDPWLVSYVAVIWDRWECVRSCLEEFEPTKTLTSTANLEQGAPRDYAAATELYLSDIWNHQLFIDILRNFDSHGCEVVSLDVDSWEGDIEEVGVGAVPKSIRWRLLKLLDSLLSKFSSKSDVLFAGNIFPFFAQARLQLRLGQLPNYNMSFFSDVRPKYALRDLPLRQKASSLLSGMSPQSEGFDNFLISRLMFDAPSSFLEDFDTLREAALSDGRRPQAIVSALCHWSNAPFKAWAAEKALEGVQFLAIAHGGALPPAFATMDFECSISDVSVVWSQTYLSNQVKLPAAKFVGTGLLNLSVSSGRWCLIIGFESTRYVQRANAQPHAGQCLACYSDIVSLCKNVTNEDLRASVRIRPYQNMGWDLESRFKDELGAEYILGKGALIEAYGEARIIVCTYPQTTFAEAMISGKPTVLLYQESLWEINENFNELLQQLRAAKIVHSDPVSLGRHLDKIWSNPEAWWSSEDVLRARESFSEMAVSVPQDAIQKWVEFLKSGKY